MLAGKYGYHLQLVACATARASHPLKPLLVAALKCQACTSKYSGFTCAFVGLRSFPLDREGRPAPYPVFRDADEGEDERPVFPLVAPGPSSSSSSASTGTFTSSSSSTTAPPAFNARLTPRIAHTLRTTAALHLPPHLALELAHAQLAHPRTARVRRALGTRTTCDGCNAAVLSGSWICAVCGREYCLECSARLAACAAPGEGEGTAAWDKLTRCKGGARPGGARHAHAQLVPLARIGAPELRRVLGAMERWRAEHGAGAGEAEGEPGAEDEDEGEGAAAWSEWVKRHRVTSAGEPEAEHGRPFVRLGAGLVPPRLDEGWRRAASAQGEEEVREDAPPQGVGQEELFRALWRRGEPLLVDLERLERAPAASASPSTSTAAPAAPSPSSTAAAPRTDPPPPAAAAPPPQHGLPALPWSPDFLALAYGDRPCTVGSNTRDDKRQTTVGKFFGGFGRGRGGRRLGARGAVGEGEGEGEGGEEEGGEGGGALWDDEGGAGARERAKPEVRFESEKIKVRSPPLSRCSLFSSSCARRDGGADVELGNGAQDWPAARDFREYPGLWHDVRLSLSLFLFLLDAVLSLHPTICRRPLHRGALLPSLLRSTFVIARARLTSPPFLSLPLPPSPSPRPPPPRRSSSRPTHLGPLAAVHGHPPRRLGHAPRRRPQHLGAHARQREPARPWAQGCVGCC